MGIKDWFSGDKKKAAYREKVKEAVGEGKLSTQKLKDLEALRKELDVTQAADDRTTLRREIYNEAVGAVREGGKLTSEEAAELAKIQKFLALRDDQVEKTKWDLARLRTLTEIRQGNLPQVPASNVALRGVQFEPDEVAHYCLAVELFDQPSIGRAEGIHVQWRTRYVADTAKVHGLPLEAAKAQGEGNLIFTDRRVILKTDGRSAAVKYGREAQIYLYADGIRLPKSVGNTLLRFRSRSEDTAEIVGELLSALMR
ncbi:MAG TPA: hypothetical protein VN878_03195 [Usitatibacter sp.]|nr:hypothetical protein [Usitatibacter sp.]